MCLIPTPFGLAVAFLYAGKARGAPQFIAIPSHMVKYQIKHLHISAVQDVTITDHFDFCSLALVHLTSLNTQS